MATPRGEEKKRGPEDEAEAEVHRAFRRSANELSQLYARSVASQNASFRAGERSSMEGVYQWISSQPEASVSVDYLSTEMLKLLNEIERRGGMAGSSQHPSPQPAHGSPSADVQANTFAIGNVAAALDFQQWQTDQARIAGISNALPSPSQQNFHPYHSVDRSGYGPNNSPPNGDGARSNHSPQNQDSVQGDLSEHSSDMDHDAP